MPKSTLISPNIADITTNRAVSNLYKQVNKLLTSFQADANLYQNDILEGTVRAVYDDGLKSCRLEAKTSKGWASVPAQLKSGSNAYTDLLKLENSGDVLIKSNLKIGRINPAIISLDNKDSKLTLDVEGNIQLNTDSGVVSIYDDTYKHFIFDCNNTMMRIYDDTAGSDYFDITVAANGASTIATTDISGVAGHLTLDPDGQIVMTPADGVQQGVIIDFDSTATTTSNRTGLFIDSDHTGIIASGQTLTAYGIDNRLNTDSPTMVGTVNAYGFINSVTCATSGTQTAYGIANLVAGADINIGYQSHVADGGQDIKMVSSANTADYCSIFTSTNGETTIRTVDADSDIAHLTLDADGDISLDAVLANSGDNIGFKNAGTIFGAFQVHHSASFLYLYENGGASTDDYLYISTGAHGASTITTIDNASHAADLTLDIDGTINLDSEDGNVYFKDSGTDMALISQDRFRMFHNADHADFFTIDIGASGATTISTVDDGATVGNLILDPDGELRITPDGDMTLVAPVGSVFKSDNSILLKELPGAVADVSGYGQIWVKTGAPNQLYFTNEDGDDIQITKGATIASQIQVAEVTVNESEMNALHTTEKTIVAAQGAGKVIVPTSGMLFVDRDGSTAQSAGLADLFISWNGGTATDTGIYYIRRFMYNEGGDRVFHLQYYQAEAGQSMTAGDNQPLTVKLDAAITSGSIDSMKVVISYHVYDNS